VANNLKLNTSNSVEIVFENLAKKRQTSMAPPLPDIERLDSLKWLGVTISRNLSVHSHV